jgi:hypothetical protein
MKHLKYFGESLFESLLNESVLYFSPLLRDKFKSMGSDISKKLLGLEGTDVTSDITFVDLVESEDDALLSFRPMRQALSKIRVVYPDANNSDLQNTPNIEVNDILYVNDFGPGKKTNVYNSTGRNTIKVGKFVKKVLGNIKDAEVEEFVNDFKSSSSLKTLNVELVSGKDITYWYDSQNYESIKGQLGNSCMAGKQFFQLYEENPEVCQLAIIQRDGKLIARALVWKVESDNNDISYFMDRPYAIMDHYVKVLTDWAQKRDMAIWNRGYGEVIFRGKRIDTSMKVKIKKLKYEDYPYLDTFRRYDYKKGYLHNDHSSRKRGYTLTSTVGGHAINDRNRLQKIGDFFGIGEDLDHKSL